ncbi:MAG TPA: response regulator [Anaerolineae bacterium]|nr:response regulator [Anaerolineae bacterium]
METHWDKALLERHLRTVLTSLYDPAVLRRSPWVALLGLEDRRDPASALRSLLIDAIESLRPHESTPLGSRIWRLYQILRRRYTEQLTQREVAFNLGLSVRQLQREEKCAREVLADHLWVAHDLGARDQVLAGPLARAGDQAAPADARMPTRAQELEWFRDSVPAQMIEVGEVIQEVLETLRPLLESSGVAVEYTVHPTHGCTHPRLPRIPLQAPMLRQALLNIVSTAIRCAPGGYVRLQAESLPQQVCIYVRAAARHDAPSPKQEECNESLEMARQLIELSGGCLETLPDTGGAVGLVSRIVLPTARQVTVLVIDDNADTLRLFQRYLSGTRYCFVGAQDAQRGLALAEELAPQVIVLDVMMPEKDGWTLLGQLREHPRTQDVPVVVCTILSHEELAFALGAAGFIRKPVNRAEFLAALDRQLERTPKEPC